MHYRQEVGSSASDSLYDYWRSRYVLYLCAAVLRAVAEFWVAGVFYRCGPKVAAFLLPTDLSELQPSEDVELES